MQRILILRPGAIGDALLSFPVIKALRTCYSAPHVLFVSNAAVLPLALDAEIAEEVSDYGSALWSGLFSTAGSRHPTLQALLQGVDLAICWLHDFDGIVEQNLHGIKDVIIAPGRPQANIETHIVDYLAHTIWPNELPLLSLQLFPSYHRLASVPRVAIHPGSGGAYKCWPIASFAAVITALWQENISVLLLAGPADHERLAHLFCLLPTPAKSELLSILQDAPLRTIAQELQHCSGYLGNDSGITHLAALLDIPTLVLFGPSNPVVWHPYGSSIKVLHEPDLANLQPDRVLYNMGEFFYHLYEHL